MIEKITSNTVISVFVILILSVLFLIPNGTDAFAQLVADPKCGPIRGESSGTVRTCSESPIPNGCIDAKVNGSLRGSIQLRLTQYLGDTPTGESVFSGNSIFTDKRGTSTLITNDVLVIGVNGYFTNFVEFLDGTGFYTDRNRGFAGLVGNVDFGAGTFEAGWEGVLCPEVFFNL